MRCALATLPCLILLAGCRPKEEETRVTSEPTRSQTGTPQSNANMPPDARMRMEEAQLEMKARAEAQGRAMAKYNPGAKR
jgi:hypothetical protein